MQVGGTRGTSLLITNSPPWLPSTACSAQGAGRRRPTCSVGGEGKAIELFQVVSILPPEQRPLLAWLRNLPDPVVEQVLSIVFYPECNMEWLLELQ